MREAPGLILRNPGRGSGTLRRQRCGTQMYTDKTLIPKVRFKKKIKADQTVCSKEIILEPRL